MNKKIDIYVNGIYVCSTKQHATCAKAKCEFSLHPSYMGVGGFTQIDPETINSIDCKFAEEK